jgi:hypothetical protein
MSNQNNSLSSQINAQEVIKKDFLNIFEVSHLFDVSAITVRRHIKSIFGQIAATEGKLLSTQNDKAKLYQELEALSNKARKKIIGQNKAGESIYLLELANKEAFAIWQLRPTIKAVIQENEGLSNQKVAQQGEQGDQTDVLSTQEPELSTQKPDIAAPAADKLSTKESEGNSMEPEKDTQKTEQIQWAPSDSFGQKYVQLLETQLSEKDDTIKDLRETNKFLSITNGKLNEQLRLLLDKPGGQPAEKK